VTALDITLDADVLSALAEASDHFRLREHELQPRLAPKNK